MATAELIVAQVLGVPEVVGGVLDVGGTLANGMAVEAVEAGLTDDVEHQFGGIADGERCVAGLHPSVGLRPEDGAEVYALFGRTSGMARHGELSAARLHLVGKLRRELQLAVDAAFEADGYELVGCRGEVLTGNDAIATHITVTGKGRVKA